MKNITVSVSEEAYREARVWAAERETSLSRVVQYFISTLLGIKRAARAFPLPNAGANKPESTSSVTNSAQKPSFPAQSSAQEPTF
jgi:hypothetical protein